MPTFSRTSYPSVLLLKADRLYAEHLRRSVLDQFPRARITVTHSSDDAWRAFQRNAYDLVLTGIGSTSKCDALEFLALCLGEGPRALKTLVVSTQMEDRIVIALHGLGVTGVFAPAHDEPKNFAVALRAVLADRLYWSEAAIERFNSAATSLLSPCRVLTASEQLTLSMLGDGCDDEVGALRLGVTSSTVSTVRRQLHRKLGLQHRGELMRIALVHGFVRFCENGVVRPGLSLLHAACDAKRRRRPAVKAA